jgi:hypothetical protein
MHFIVQWEKKMQPLPDLPVMGGSSPKCGPQRKTLRQPGALQKPFPTIAVRLALHCRGHNSQEDICCMSFIVGENYIKKAYYVLVISTNLCMILFFILLKIL